MTVLDLLEEIEDIVETASTVPLTNKIMIDGDELLEIVKEIRQSLPDDVQQAKWVRDEKERILAEAKEEYEKIIVEANKQADYLVDTDDITKRAEARAAETKAQSEEYARVMKMKTYDYLDKVLYDMQGRFEELNGKYLNELFQYMSKTMENMTAKLQNNRDELKQMAYEANNEEPEQ